MSPDVDLSDRELEILRLVATGASNKEIAQKLVISPNTVKVHLRNVFAKIGAASRTEAAMFALRSGLVDHVVQPSAPLEETAAEEPAPNGSGPLEPEGALAGLPVSLVQPEPAGFSIQRLLPWTLLLALAVLLVVGALLLLRQSPAAQPPALTPTAALPLVSSAQRWQDDASLPLARRGMAAEAYESAIYLTGGETPAGVTGSTLRYNADQDRWETLADKPTPVADIEAALIGEQIYVPGGRTAGGQPTDVLEVYDLRLNRWETRAPLPVALSGYALAAVDGRLYLFGGWDGQKTVATVYSYDPSTNAWQPRTPLSSPRAFSAAVALEGRIYLIGGADGSQHLTTVQVYFPQRDQAGDLPWEDRAAMPDGRSAMGATVIADLIYVFGGEGNSQPEGGLPPLQYTPLNDHWTSFDRSPVAVGAHPVLVPLETRLHVIGGATPGGMSVFHQSYQAVYTIQLPSVQK
jgi:DNA-binding CsgD family transcriptional regulator/N-acetylneuraminic acid mutarotase